MTGAIAGRNAASRIAVVGSVNLDLVAHVKALPEPGETVTGARLSRHPGGKGANQALAARRLGAHVNLFAQVGDDSEAKEALALLEKGGVDLANCRPRTGMPTGLAMIVVAEDGENQITVAPGANAAYRPDRLPLEDFDAVLCQLEVPDDALSAAAASAGGLFCINLAPYRPIPAACLARADLLVLNEGEARLARDDLAPFRGRMAVTFGADGARLYEKGQELAAARPPAIDAADATGAGDAFTAALVVGLLEEASPQEALAFACAAGAAAAMREGTQPALPVRGDIERLLKTERER